MRYFSMCFTIALAGLSLVMIASTRAAECLPTACTAFPADAGVINVRDFGAKGDGVHDDTAAILAAIRSPLSTTAPYTIAHAVYDAPIIYFPRGVYLVSDTLSKRYPDGRYANRMVLMGASKEETTIRLIDSALGYADPKALKAIVYTSSALFDGTATSGGKDYNGRGEGNDAYLNYVENITIDAGRHNPGAIGIDYLASNLAAIRNVTITSEDRQGAIGVSLLRKWIGPALLKDVVVEGFDIGIDVANPIYSVTMEGIRLSHQKVAGLRNDENVLAIRHLEIESDVGVPAILNRSTNGLIVIDGAVLRGGPGDVDAIENVGYLNLQRVGVEGFARVLGQATPSEPIDGVYSANQRISGSRAAWSIEAQDPDLPAPDNPRDWKSVTAYGARADGTADSTTAIQAAFNSGAATIYFPRGIYAVHGGIDIPPSVKRVEGMMSVIHLSLPRNPGFNVGIGVLRLHNDKGPLLIEKLVIDAAGSGGQIGVEALGRGVLTIRDIFVLGAKMLRSAEAGPVFFENVATGIMEITGPRPVWARQLNSEGGGTRILNEGSPLWILGLKTEGNCTVLDNERGAVTEILGGLLYPVRPFADPTIPAFINHDGKLLASYAEVGYLEGSTYRIHLVSTVNGAASQVDASSLPARPLRPDGFARMVPRLVTGE